MSGVLSVVRLRLKVGQMAPTPAIASALGQRGVNIMKFLQNFNSLVKDYKVDSRVIVLAKIFKNKTFEIFVKGRPLADLLKEKADLSKGSSEPGKIQIGEIDMSQVVQIAQIKMERMHSKGIDGMVRMVLGTARSIGMKVVYDSCD